MLPTKVAFLKNLVFQIELYTFQIPPKKTTIPHTLGWLFSILCIKPKPPKLCLKGRIARCFFFSEVLVRHLPKLPPTFQPTKTKTLRPKPTPSGPCTHVSVCFSSAERQTFLQSFAPRCHPKVLHNCNLQRLGSHRVEGGRFFSVLCKGACVSLLVMLVQKGWIWWNMVKHETRANKKTIVFYMER